MRSLLPVVFFTAVLVGPGFAQDPIVTVPAEQQDEEETAGSPLSVTIDNSVGFNSETPGAFSEHGVDF